MPVFDTRHHTHIYHLVTELAQMLIALIQLLPLILSAGDRTAFNTVLGYIPVPMHWTKRIRRGYNQATYIASGISGVTGIPIADNLKAVRPHRSQTRNGIRQRIQNVSGIFSVAHPSELNGLSLLVVDDVITTGSTMTQCCGMLHSQSHPAAVSVLSLALSEST